MQMKTFVAVLLISMLGALATGCSIVVDGALQDRDAGGTGMDGSIVSCTGLADGTMCGGGRVCIDEACEASECGDGVVDPALGEECDDENDVAGDGCEDNCDFSCEDAADCDDGLPCNGPETCSAEHTCVEGTPPGDGSECTQPGGEAGVCRDADCVPAGCGNMLIADGEECDDGNTMDGDGCDSDCTFTCTEDAHCDDLSVCSGAETCDVASHLCVPGTPLMCDDGNVCTQNVCDAEMGCVYPLIDMDADGHASIDLGACGTDCNDMRADVNPDAVELCGDALDSDCNGDVNPTSTPFWYLDCDDDGYSVLGAASQQACMEPTPGACGGGWTTRVPVTGDSRTLDCVDGNRNVFPGQTTYYSTPISGVSTSRDYDYNCDGEETRRWTLTSVSTTASCTDSILRGFCIGSSGWTGTTAPACGASAGLSLCAYNTRAGECVRTRYTSRAQECR